MTDIYKVIIAAHNVMELLLLLNGLLNFSYAIDVPYDLIKALPCKLCHNHGY